MTVSKGIYRQWEKTGTKKCLKCGVEQSVENFYWQKGSNGRRPHSYCKPCHIKWGTIKRRQQPASHKAKMTRKKWLLARFGISLDDYEKMLVAQNGVCAICGEREMFANRKLAVDHCHQKGRVRGLLCGNCNTAIGKFKDSLPLLQKAMEYLRGHGAVWL